MDRRPGARGVAARTALAVSVAAVFAACQFEPDADPARSDDELVRRAGAATIALEAASSTELRPRIAATTTDEYVRVGQRLRVRVSHQTLWRVLYGASPPPAAARLSQLHAEIGVHFYRPGWTRPDQSVALELGDWTATPAGSTTGATDSTSVEFAVPPWAGAVAFGALVRDAATPARTAEVGADLDHGLIVLGASGRYRTALFDLRDGVRRERILEAGALRAGRDVLLAVSDRRAELVSNAATIDRRIGTREVLEGGRWVLRPVEGDLAQIVSFVISVDGGRTFWREMRLDAVPGGADALLPAGRLTFEAMVVLPGPPAANVRVRFRVRQYLIVDYARHALPGSNVVEWRYRDGTRVLVRDAWDSPAGPGGGYELPVGLD